MGLLLIGSLGAEIFCPQIVWNIRSIVSTIKFFFWDCGWFEPTKSCLRQQSIILSPAMVADLVVARRLVKAPEKRGGGTPALGVHQKICSVLTSTSRHHQTSPDTNGGYALRLGKFDSKDFCCIVDVWRQKRRRVCTLKIRVEQFVPGF